MSEKNFTLKLDSVIKKHKSRHGTIIAGDFNAKTGSAREEKIYHDNIGKYGKGKTNNNGYHLLNFVKTHNLKLTNTYFKHKSTHRSTWEAPERTKGCIDKQAIQLSTQNEIQKPNRFYMYKQQSSKHNHNQCKIIWRYDNHV